MKPTSALLFLLAPLALAPAGAQTKAPVHHSTAASHRAPSACGAFAAPTLAASIPKAAGCPKPLYALTFVDTVVGTGAEVTPRKWLTVAYTGYLLDGTKFDSSIGKDPITFPYGAHQVITGWDTGFEGMHIGGHRRLFIPYELAYGEAGRPPVIPVKAELVFDLELIAISDTPPAPKTPPAPPAGSTPPAGSRPATDAPAQPGTQPGAPQTTGKPTTSPTPDPSKATAPVDPTKPAAVPPK